MSGNPSHLPTAVVGALLAFALTEPADAWPFGGGDKPATPAASAKTDPKADAGPQKATPEQRAAAQRLAPLGRAAFWQHEVGVDPKDAEAGVNLASALRTLGRFDEAADSSERVLVFAPKNEDALLESARDHIAAGHGFYSIAPLKQAEALYPKDWRAASLMGVALEQDERPDDALAAYAQALKLSPNNPAVLTNLGLFYATRGDAARAETLLRQAAAQPTASIQERQNLALVLGLQGKLPEAERLMRQDLPPETADANLQYLKASYNRGATAAPAGSGVSARPAPPTPARTWSSVQGSDAKGG